jgi:metal-responsive CopG/Arc/MetJ family transcriptional regulator
MWHSCSEPVRESISISLPAELKAELDRAIATEGISRSDLVREALRDYLFARRFRALRAEMLPYAEAQGVFTDEDVFRLVS